MKLIGKHIAAARGLLSMSQTDLASATGLVPATIMRFEAGTHEPRPATLDLIRQFFEARGVEFTNGDGVGVRLRHGPASDTKPPAP